MGLSDLISSNTNAEDQSLSEKSPASGQDSEPATQDQTPERLSEYEKLAAAQSWEELSALCEKNLSLPGQDEALLERCEARIWWIRSQFATQSVPASILAAPLDSVSKLIVEKWQNEVAQEERDKLFRMCLAAGSILSEVAARLRKDGDSVLGLSFLERAFRLDRRYSHDLKETAQEELAKISPHTLTSPSVSGFAQYLEKLLAELQIFQTQIAEPGKQARPKPDEPEAGPRKSHGSTTAAPQAAGSPTRSRTRQVALVGVIGGLAIALLYSAAAGTRPSVSSLHFQFVGLPEAAAAAAPSAERIEKLSTLDALFYDIQRAAPGPADQRQLQGPENEVRRAAAQGEKETVNTTSPVEGPEISSAAAGGPGAGQSPSSAKPPEPRFADASGQQAPSLALAPTFETFPRARKYSIIAPTRVMLRPSIVGQPVEQLASGAEISVEGKEGYWLKIRSKQGRVGYVLAQDATPTQDW